MSDKKFDVFRKNAFFGSYNKQQRRKGRKDFPVNEYKIWVLTPGKGRIVVTITANSAAAAMAAAKNMGGPGSSCGILSCTHK